MLVTSAIETLLTDGTGPCRALRWNASQSHLWWVDVENDRVLACDAWGMPLPERRMQGTICTATSTASGRILLGLAKRLCLVDAFASGRGDTSQMSVLAAIDPADTRTVIGDGRTDRSGAYVFGTTNVSGDARPIGSFYQFSARSGLSRLAMPTVVATSCICFSLDGTRLYFADATTSLLQTCRYDGATASVTDVRPFAQALRPGWTMCDAFVDRRDCVWVAQQSPDGHGAVVQYAQDGSIRQVVQLAGSIEGCTVGGPNLGQLFTLDAEGGIHVVENVEVEGTAEVPFDDLRYQGAALGRLLNPQPVGAAATRL
jgi:L-arabinonolactonase